MDKETYEYLTREVESDIEKQQLELESELQEKLKSQVFLGKTEEERNALKIKAEEQLRLEKESKLKSYTKNIEAQHFANNGGSKEAAQQQMEQEAQKSQAEKFQKEQEARAQEQARENEAIKQQEARDRQGKEEKKAKEDQIAKEVEKKQNAQEAKRLQEEAERDRLRQQFDKANEHNLNHDNGRGH